MNLFDLRLRGSMYTLGAVVNETDHDHFRELLMYLQGIAVNEDVEVPDSFELLPNDAFSKERCDALSKWLISEGYAAKVSDSLYVLTSKTFDVFEKTIAKDKELSESGFYTGCCFHC